MKEDPLKDDWINLIKEDMIKFNIDFSDEEISKMNKIYFRKIVKSKMRKYVFETLETMKQGHSKVRDIIHGGLLYPQPYLTNPMFSNKQASLLLNLRSSCVNEFKSNFFTSSCPVCKINSDTQQHALLCTELKKYIKKEDLVSLSGVVYTDIFSDTEKQLQVTLVFHIIIQTRERLRAP